LPQAQTEPPNYKNFRDCLIIIVYMLHELQTQAMPVKNDPKTGMKMM